MQPQTSNPVVAALPRLSVALLGDTRATLRAFPDKDGHTLVGQCVDNWATIPDGQCVIVELNDGTAIKGYHHRSAFVQQAEFQLSDAPGTAPRFAGFVELVQAVWQPLAYVAGEAFIIPAPPQPAAA